MRFDFDPDDTPKAAPRPQRSKILDQQERAYERGQLAREAGKRCLDNPYSLTSANRIAWTAGYFGSSEWAPMEMEAA